MNFSHMHLDHGHGLAREMFNLMCSNNSTIAIGQLNNLVLAAAMPQIRLIVKDNGWSAALYFLAPLLST